MDLRRVADVGADQVSLVNVYSQPVAYQFASVMTYLDGAGLVKVNLHPSNWSTPEDAVSFLDYCRPELYTGNPISLAAPAGGVHLVCSARSR